MEGVGDQLPHAIEGDPTVLGELSASLCERFPLSVGEKSPSHSLPITKDNEGEDQNTPKRVFALSSSCSVFQKSERGAPGLKSPFGSRILRGPKGPSFHRRPERNVFATSSTCWCPVSHLFERRIVGLRFR